MTKVEYEKVADAWAKLKIVLGVLESVKDGETELFVRSEWLNGKGEFDFEKVLRYSTNRLTDVYIILDKLILAQPDDKRGHKCSK